MGIGVMGIGVAGIGGALAGTASPGSWEGTAAQAYARWATDERAAAAAVDETLREAARIVAAHPGDDGAGLARRLAALDLPHAQALPNAALPNPALPEGAAPLPAAVRDAANRARLAADLRGLRARPEKTHAERARLDREQALDEHLAALARRRDPITGAPVSVQLYEFDPDAFGGDGAAVVSIGDLDTADNVGVIVPGMGTTMGSLGSVAGDASRLYDAARAAAPAQTDATLAWIGYDAPSGPFAAVQVATRGLARRGGDELRADLWDIAAMRRERDPRLVVFAHSYGSTTAGFAGHDGALAPVVDSMVLLGSPGVGPVTRAQDFGVPDVYVAATDDDPVTWLGGYPPFGLGVDPAAESFGAIRLAASAPPGTTSPLATHSHYFDEGSEALANFARVLTGEGAPRTTPGRITVDLPGPIDLRREPAHAG